MRNVYLAKVKIKSISLTLKSNRQKIERNKMMSFGMIHMFFCVCQGWDIVCGWILHYTILGLALFPEHFNHFYMNSITCQVSNSRLRLVFWVPRYYINHQATIAQNF